MNIHTNFDQEIRGINDQTSTCGAYRTYVSARSESKAVEGRLAQTPQATDIGISNASARLVYMPLT